MRLRNRSAFYEGDRFLGHRTDRTPSHSGRSEDAETARPIQKLIDGAKTIIVTGHERPDGDCIGSTVALCAILREIGKDARVVNADAAPTRYQFLSTAVPYHVPADGEKMVSDLTIVLDSTDLSRLGRVKREQFTSENLIDMDHHLGNPHFGAANWVDTKACAAAELVWRLASICKWPVPMVALQGMYAGLMTDTGQFSYGNTRPRTLRMAAEMMDRGLDFEKLWQRIYLNKPWGELQLEARARASLQAHLGGRICSMAIRDTDFVETKTGPQHTEDLASIPRSVEGVELAIFMYGLPGGKRTKISFRSTQDLDARQLAQQFNGGGHRQAAGATVELPLDEARATVIAAAEKFLLGATKSTH